MTGNERFEALLSDLRIEYLDGLGDSIEFIESRLLRLERRELSPDDFTDLLRKVHAVKGSAATYGLQLISSICHRLEEELGLDRAEAERSPGVTDRLMGYVDLMRDVGASALALAESPDELPRAMADAAQRLSELVSGPRARVLLIERSAVSCRLLAHAAELGGVQLSIAHDGYAGLGRCLIEQFKLVVVARSAETISGPSLVAAIKLEIAGQKVALLTSDTSFEDRRIPAHLAPDFLLVRDAQLSKSAVSLFRSLGGR